MSASTRIFLAVTALVAVVLVLYYGVFSGDSPGGPQIARATEEPTQTDKAGHSVSPRDAPPRLVPPPRFIEETPAPPPLSETLAESPAADPVIEDLAPVDLRATDETTGGKDGPTPEPADEMDEDAQEEVEDTADDDPEPEPASGGEADRTETPPPPAPTPAPRAPQYTEYTVKSGDTMSTIAAEWFGDASKWDLIAKANPFVDPARLQVGQALRLPPKDTERDEIEEKAGDKPIEYTVRSGDTLSKIARAYYGHERHWQRIYDANKAAIGDNPGNLKPGMKLTIPPATSE